MHQIHVVAVSPYRQAFRTDDVDISATTDGFAVGWARADEYLRYTVNVEATGKGLKLDNP